MLVCRHPIGPTRNLWVKKFFLMLIPEKQNLFSDIYMILAMLTLQSKVNFLFFLLHHFLFVRVVLTLLTHCPLWKFRQTPLNQQLETRMAKIHFRLTHKYCVILNVQYRLFFTKLRGMGGTFHKNSFILETKLNVPKNFLLRIKREVQFP